MTFECATNLTGYNLFFETKVSFELTSNGMMVSMSFKASIEVNGTAVICRASNGDATEPAYVYVQGQYIHECVMAYNAPINANPHYPPPRQFQGTVGRFEAPGVGDLTNP